MNLIKLISFAATICGSLLISNVNYSSPATQKYDENNISELLADFQEITCIPKGVSLGMEFSNLLELDESISYSHDYVDHPKLLFASVCDGYRGKIIYGLNDDNPNLISSIVTLEFTNSQQERSRNAVSAFEKKLGSPSEIFYELQKGHKLMASVWEFDRTTLVLSYSSDLGLVLIRVFEKQSKLLDYIKRSK